MSSCRQNYTTAIILAGGCGSRFESDIPKQFCDICGKTVLRRATEAFYKCNDVDKIVIVTRSEDMEFARNELRFASDKIHSFVTGGHTRRESAEKGFLSIPKETKYVAIHDAARCLITPEDVSMVLSTAYKSGAASVARRVNDTVKVIENGTIIDTVPRDGLVFAETPQVFSCELYEKALKSMTESITDDNMLLEKICVPITPVFLSLPNPKITTKSDLDFAEFLVSRRDRDYDRECRIGQGYDVHRFAEGRKLILGGVEIPCEKGLLGHSDADVLVHAIMDALLGAAGLGDIGRHFPDTDKEYRGISSIKLLRCVADMINREGFEVLNVDSTVILQKPKISPHIEAMQKNISSALCISERSVNVKATTEEGLGFTGRGEGAKAEAVAMIRKK